MKEHRGMKHICVALALIIVATTILPARDFTVFDIVGDSVSAGVNPDYYAPYKNYGWAHILFGEGGGSLPPPVADTITPSGRALSNTTAPSPGQKPPAGPPRRARP